MSWPVGNAVVVQGLISEEGRRLNGMRGLIQGSDEATGRLMISFNAGSSPSPPSTWKKIRPWNVRFHRTFTADTSQQNDLASAVGSEIWSRVLSYCHIEAWTQITAVAPVLYTAAGLAATAVPYDGSRTIAAAAFTASFVWLRRTCVRTLDVYYKASSALDAVLAARPRFFGDYLPLSLEHLVLRSQGSMALGTLTALPNLLHLNITNAHPTHRLKLLCCSLPRLLELRAGSPQTVRSAARHREDMLLESILALKEHLVALDIGYLSTSSGIDAWFWQPLFTERSLRALDFSMVMRWVDFDAALECITDNLQLESLAIHGLSISNRAFKRFCETCPLQHLRFRDCSAHEGMLVPAYTACSALKTADFGSSLTELSSRDVLALHSWLEVRQPKHFVFTGVVHQDENTVVAAQALVAAFSDSYDLCIVQHSGDWTHPALTLDGDWLHPAILRQHGSKCRQAQQRFFDICASIDVDFHDVLLL